MFNSHKLMLKHTLLYLNEKSLFALFFMGKMSAKSQTQHFQVESDFI